MANRDYVQTNRSWLEAKAKQEGVMPLSKGVYYKVLAEGNKDSAKPTPSSIIILLGRQKDHLRKAQGKFLFGIRHRVMFATL